jgi:hypothetical protein
MSEKESKETIQLAVLDSVLYGAARAFEFLGERGQGMMDRIGEGIVDYCTRLGYLEDTGNLDELSERMIKFFEENGYFRVEVTEEGDVLAYAFRGYQYVSLDKKLRARGNELLACPWCIADDALSRRKGKSAQASRFVFVSHEKLPDGFISRFRVTGPGKAEDIESEKRRHGQRGSKSGEIPPDKVGLPAFEAVEYGLARGFEYLGAQAQLFLDDSGEGIIEFLREEFQLSPSKDMRQNLESLASFYSSHGLADRIEVELSSSAANIVFTNYRYLSVLKQLLEDGTNLVSCPFTLATRKVLRDAGLAVGGMKWRVGDDRNVVLTSELVRVEDQEFDEDRVARLMDSAAQS